MAAISDDSWTTIKARVAPQERDTVHRCTVVCQVEKSPGVYTAAYILTVDEVVKGKSCCGLPGVVCKPSDFNPKKALSVMRAFLPEGTKLDTTMWDTPACIRGDVYYVATMMWPSAAPPALHSYEGWADAGWLRYDEFSDAQRLEPGVMLPSITGIVRTKWDTELPLALRQWIHATGPKSTRRRRY